MKGSFLGKAIFTVLAVLSVCFSSLAFAEPPVEVQGANSAHKSAEERAKSTNPEVRAALAARMAKIANFDQLSRPAKVLTLACGERKSGMPFTDEELNLMVKVGASQPEMNNTVCKAFLQRQAI